MERYSLHHSLHELVPKCKDMVENMGVGDSNTSSHRTQSSAVDVIKDLDIDVVIESATRKSKCKWTTHMFLFAWLQLSSVDAQKAHEVQPCGCMQTRLLNRVH